MRLRPSARSLFPDCVVGAELTDFAQGSPLFPEEEDLVTNAVEARIVEFRAGRHCAREALRIYGREPVPILATKNRAPIWPEGIVGAITHCKGYCGVVLAPCSVISGIGFDVQTPNAVSSNDWIHIASSVEKRSNAPRAWRTIAFCAKEAIYKAQYQLTRSWLGFEEIHIEALEPGTFLARLERDVSRWGYSGQSILGRYAEDEEFVFAGVCLTKDSGLLTRGPPEDMNLRF